MANVTFYQPTDMGNFDWFYHLSRSPSDLTKTAIRMNETVDAPPFVTYSAVYYGNFKYGFFTPEDATAADKLGVISGTLTGYDFYEDQVLRVHMTGLNYDILSALVYVDLSQDHTKYPGYGTELLSILLSGNDSIQGSAFDDKLFGFDGNDTVNGGARQDVLKGGNGADQLNGGFGNDFMSGNSGKDLSAGGAGSDTFLFTTVNSAKGDTIADFSRSQHDVISFQGAGLTFADLAFAHSGGNTQIEIDSNGDSSPDAILTLIGNYNLSASDFIFI